MELGYKKIKNLQKHMQDIVQCYSFRQIFQIYKNISKQIIMFMKIFKVGIQKCQGIKQKLEQCVKLIYSLVNSVQYPKYGHRLPLLAYIARKYQQQFKNKVQQNPKLTHQRILLNQKQEQIEQCCVAPFQWKYLTQANYNQQFKSISNGQIKLHDAQCVCCCQVFVKGIQITNKNTIYPVLIGLTQKENSYMDLQRYICAVCNAGGGVILVGVDKKINSLWSSGIKHKDQQHLQQNINKIYTSLSSIKPQFYWTVQKIVVQSNFLQKNLIEEELMRFCFRIAIYPLNLTRKYYLQIINKGYNSIYQVYQLDLFNKPEKIIASKHDQSIFTFYSLVTDYYNCNKNKYNQFKTNNHYTFCRRPLMQYSKLFHQFSINKQAVTQEKDHKESAEQGIQQQIQPNVQDQPSFKYLYSSLLTVGSKKKEKFIKEFSNYLKSKKMLHSLEKPFPNSFKDGPRPLWLLSHHDQLNIIKSVLKQFDKSEHITLIPVYKTLQIDRVRLTAQKEQILRQKFYSKYPEGYQIQELPQQNNISGMTNPIFVSFNSYFHAIFGYMIFESLQLRPFFVKQNTTYKKKPKIISA